MPQHGQNGSAAEPALRRIGRFRVLGFHGSLDDVRHGLVAGVFHRSCRYGVSSRRGLGFECASVLRARDRSRSRSSSPPDRGSPSPRCWRSGIALAVVAEPMSVPVGLATAGAPDPSPCSAEPTLRGRRGSSSRRRSSRRTRAPPATSTLATTAGTSQRFFAGGVDGERRRGCRGCEPASHPAARSARSSRRSRARASRSATARVGGIDQAVRQRRAVGAASSARARGRRRRCSAD